MTFTYYEDPGHGWLEVSHKLIKELNIGDKISSFSYMNSQNAYLEEDCDAEVFIKAYKEKYGETPNFTTTHQEHSFVRNLSDYSN